MKIQSNSSNDRLPQTSNLSINGQGNKKETDKVQVLFGKAATWQMSNMAKRLKEVAEWEHGKGPLKKALDTAQALEKERLEKKDAANKLEKQLGDFTLSEEDKKKMQEEIDKLREEAKSPQDKQDEAIKEFNDKLSAIKKQQKDALEGERGVFANSIRYYQEEISGLEEKKAHAISSRGLLDLAALQEETERLAKKIHEDALPEKEEVEAAGPSFGTVMDEQQLLLKKKKEEEEKEKKSVDEAMGKPEEETEKTEEGTKESADAEKESDKGNQNKR